MHLGLLLCPPYIWCLVVMPPTSLLWLANQAPSSPQTNDFFWGGAVTRAPGGRRGSRRGGRFPAKGGREGTSKQLGVRLRCDLTARTALSYNRG